MADTLTSHGEVEDWDGLVAEGVRLTGSEGSLQFRLGDLGLDLVPLPPKGKRLPMAKYKLLADFAEEIGQTRERFEEYRLVAGAWPKAKRNRQVCWTVHAYFARHPDRFLMINNPPLYRRSGQRRWTCDSARKVLGWTSEETEPTTEDRLRQVEEILAADDDLAVTVVERAMTREPVVRKVAQRQPARDAFNRAQVEEVRTAHEATRRMPEVQRINEESEVLTVLGLCHSFSHGIGRALPGLHLAQLSEDAQGSIREGLERVTAAVGWTEHVLETGQTDMDAALERLIAGE
ncbi:DUF6192 family protein [Streptomyces sp. NPDC026589]|uniref:DUF6192 family protein n=1 Tax=Streptomyces sp. NPDC026589 TaxID=3155609 RepID=UPI0033ECA7FB